MLCNSGIYFDNYYVRLLSASCGECKLGADANAKGCAAHTPARPFRYMNRTDLDRAKLVLDRFDIVLITEQFSRNDVNNWLKQKIAREFGINHDWSTYGRFEEHMLGWQRQNAVVPSHTHKPELPVVSITQSNYR